MTSPEMAHRSAICSVTTASRTAAAPRIGVTRGSTRRVSLEGIIGAGKSLFLGNLRDRFFAGSTASLTIVDEPVSEWCKTTDRDGKSVLSYFYEDTERYAFMFQINALMTRYSATTRANDIVRSHIYDSQAFPESSWQGASDHVILLERTIATDREVFANMLHEAGKLSDIEHTVYKNTYDTLAARRPECACIDGVVYIHTTPTQAKERIDKRNRKGEDVSFEYLCDCEAAHHEWLANANFPVLIVDGAVDAADSRFTQMIEIAEKFLTAEYWTLPAPCNHWQTALQCAEQDGVALFDNDPHSLLGQEVQGVESGGRIVPNVVGTVDGLAEELPEEDPFEKPAPVYACL